MSYADIPTAFQLLLFNVLTDLDCSCIGQYRSGDRIVFTLVNRLI